MRIFIEAIEHSFSKLYFRSIQLLDQTSDTDLYRKPRELHQTFAMFTIGEYILRSAASIEQTFGGLTTRLWDDPFEWTLPEKLATIDLVRNYLNDVEATKRSGFAFLATDGDLEKQIPSPIELKPIFRILIDTLARAEHYQGRAYAVFQMISDKKLPKI